MTVHASTRHGLARRSHPKGGGAFGNGGQAPGYKRWLMNERAGGETRNSFCAGTTRGTRPCQHRAMNGSDYCHGHDPDRQAERDELMAAMRARSPRHDPANLTAASEIQAELAAYFEASDGRWVELAAATGCSNSQLGRWLRCPPDQPMLRETVARLRRGLDQVRGLQLAA